MNKTEQEILNIKDPRTSHWYCYYCLNNKKAANIKEHEKIVLESKDAKYAYYFAKNIPEANKERLFTKVLELNDLYYICLFLKNIDFDKEKYKHLLLFI